jgi:hypothetical protein
MLVFAVSPSECFLFPPFWLLTRSTMSASFKTWQCYHIFLRWNNFVS